VLQEPEMTDVAVIQMGSGPNKENNIKRALSFTAEALSKRSQFICLPEYFYFRGNLSTEAEISRIVEPVNGATVREFAVLAKKGKAYILLGSIYEKTRSKGRAYNTSVLIGPDGEVKAVYRKQHLFHLRMPGSPGGEIRESFLFNAGTKKVIVPVGPFMLGMTMCFEVRFPMLYEWYARRGVNLFTIPASFAHATGQAHWELLVRARAVETFSYVIAPDQTGLNAQGYRCWGQSMIVDPWGEILAQASNAKEEIIYASLDPKKPQRLRRMFPGFKPAFIN